MDATQFSGDSMRDPSAFTALTRIHKKSVLDCCFSPETDQIATASEDGTAVLWNLPPIDRQLHDDTINDDHKLVCYRLSDHKQEVTSVAMHKKLLLSATKDGEVKLWPLEPSGHSTSHPDARRQFKQPSPKALTYRCHQRSISSICFAPNGSCFATGSGDMVVKIWSTECVNKSFVTFHQGHKNWVKCVRWSKANDSLLASCGDDGRICIWDARTNVAQIPCMTLQVKRSSRYNCLDWHPVFWHHIASGDTDKSCYVWDLRTRKQVQVYKDHEDSVNSVAFDSGGSLLLSGSKDKTSRIYDVCEGRNLFTLKSHDDSVTSVCFSASGELIATGSMDKTVTVWKRNFDTVTIVLNEKVSGLEETYSELVGNPVNPAEIRHRSHNYYTNRIN